MIITILWIFIAICRFLEISAEEKRAIAEKEDNNLVQEFPNNTSKVLYYSLKLIVTIVYSLIWPILLLRNLYKDVKTLCT